MAQHRKDPEATKRLDDLKETLALLSGLEAKSVGDLDHYLGLVDQILNGKRPFDRALFKNANGPVTAEQIYMNQKVSDLMSNAEMDQSDYRRGNKPNVFFGAQKRYFGVKFDVFFFNTSVLILSTLGIAWAVALDFAKRTRSKKKQISCVGRAFRLSSDGFGNRPGCPATPTGVTRGNEQIKNKTGPPYRRHQRH